MKIKIPSILVKPSTISFTREAFQVKEFSFFDWLHGIVYARWPYLYIGIGTGEHKLARRFGPTVKYILGLFKPRSDPRIVETKTDQDPAGKKNGRTTFADSYHGKVVPINLASQLVSVNEEIKLPNLEHVIPYKKARDIILKNPDHIVVLDCPCRVSRENPCLPLDVCLIIGEPFASYVMEHHPQRAKWVTQEQAVEVLQAEEARGHVHHAFFKDAMLGRFYAICNCCSCCCGAMQAHRNGTPMLTSSGFVARVNQEECLACGTCESNCQFGAIRVTDDYAEVDQVLCMGCGVCVSMCEQAAVELLRDPVKGEPLEIFSLMELSSH